VDPSAVAEHLISYDTSTLEGIQSAAGFVKGWLEARDIEVEQFVCRKRPALVAGAGTLDGPTIVFHGHLDVVPAHKRQFSPQRCGDRLIGRGAYDMKGGLAAMMCAMRELSDQQAVGVRFLCVADEEAEYTSNKATDLLVKRGFSGDFAITGEPTDMKIGVQAKGVLAMRITVWGRSAHGSRPWLGDNAITKAVGLFSKITQLSFASASSELFDRPSVNIGRIVGGDALNKVPESCTMDVDVRYLPGQDHETILESVKQLGDLEISVLFHREPCVVSALDPYVQTLAHAVAPGTEADQVSVGRDGASDAVSFLRAGVPAVEFGPSGADHHGPEEWVSICSLDRYRDALVEFVANLAVRPRTSRLGSV
jgi:succinyl-diaminopimelate desuccinylase